MKTKWSGALAAAVFLIAGLIHAQADLLVRIGESNATPSSEILVPIEIANASDVGSLHVEILYDSDVVNAVRVENQTNGLLDSNLSEPGRAVIGLVTTNGLSGEVVVADVTFEVNGPSGTQTELRLVNLSANDATSLADLPLEAENGLIVVGMGPATSAGGNATLWVLGIVALLSVLGIALYLFTRNASQANHQANLVVMSGNASPHHVAVGNKGVLIGRGPDCDLILNDELASRNHARVMQQDGAFVISDLNSANGTKVNGTPATSHRLNRGDIIEIGSSRIQFS